MVLNGVKTCSKVTEVVTDLVTEKINDLIKLKLFLAPETPIIILIHLNK